MDHPTRNGVLLIGYPPTAVELDRFYRFDTLEEATAYKENPPPDETNYGWSAHTLKNPR